MTSFIIFSSTSFIYFHTVKKISISPNTPHEHPSHPRLLLFGDDIKLVLYYSLFFTPSYLRTRTWSRSCHNSNDRDAVP